MKQIFRNKRITGVLGLLPQNESLFDNELDNYTFSASQTNRLKKIMGYEKHRLVKGTTCASDLVIYGFKYLFDNAILSPAEIDALIVVTQTPDYFIPPTSNIIQGKVGLRKDILCLDISQGCAGFLVGLLQSFLMLTCDGINKVALVNTDILSKKVSKADRNSFPLIGDAASITIVEKTNDNEEIYFNLYMDGSRSNALIIPAGGFKQPSSPETAILKDAGDGNLRSMDNLTMDGTAIFNFVQTEVPEMINELLEYAGCKKEEIDYFLFHQPNKFMLEKLADKIGIPREKVPTNIVTNYGNSSGVTIPINIVHNLANNITKQKYKCCLAGFGGGLSWSSMVLDLGNMDFCKMVETPF